MAAFCKHASNPARALAARVLSPVALVAGLLLGTLAGCTQAAAVETDLARVQHRLEQVLADGAYFCAPRELALARAQLDFARVDHGQGELAAARKHLARAELNVRAAARLSPAERCAGHGGGTPEPQPVFGNGEEPDSDMDGIPDSADTCPSTPEDTDGYLDTDGCPDLDNDDDGVPDTIDQCPFQAEDKDGDRDDDGCPDVEADRDGDGVTDALDHCPDQAGVPSNEGCPRVRYKGAELTDSALRTTDRITFEDQTATIRSVSYPVLDIVVGVMKEHPTLTLEVQGHTDSQGDDDANMALSQARAETVVRYLVQHGIEPARLTAKGYGETRPIESNRTSQGREINRRVEFIRTDTRR